MCDGEDTALATDHQLTERSPEGGITGAIDRSGRLVEEQYGGFVHERACQSEQLSLSSREVRSPPATAATELRVVALQQRPDEGIGTAEATCRIGRSGRHRGVAER